MPSSAFTIIRRQIRQTVQRRSRWASMASVMAFETVEVAMWVRAISDHCRKGKMPAGIGTRANTGNSRRVLRRAARVRRGCGQILTAASPLSARNPFTQTPAEATIEPGHIRAWVIWIGCRRARASARVTRPTRMPGRKVPAAAHHSPEVRRTRSDTAGR